MTSRLSALFAIILCSTFLIATSSCKNTEGSNPSFNPDTGENIGVAINGEVLSLKAIFDYALILENDPPEYAYLLVETTGGALPEVQKRTPLNISLVMDRSGSMRHEDKFDYVQQACKMVVDNLNDNDRLSIVTYENSVDVLKQAGFVENKTSLKNRIAGLQPAGGTNLGAGVEEGFQQTAKKTDIEAVNRVLLLSDGLANAGITEPSELQRMVRNAYKENGTAISTFGVGVDYNEDLMTNLAESGLGNYYYISNPNEIPTIFEKELQGLLSVIAQNTKLHIDFPEENFDVEEVFGYSYEVNEGVLQVDYNDIFADETKAVLIKFKIKERPTDKQNFDITLAYDDVSDENNRKQLREEISLETTSDREQYEQSVNEEVLRNITLFWSTQQVEEAAKAADRGEYDIARGLIDANKAEMKEFFDQVKPDSALLNQYNNIENYEKDLKNIEQRSADEVKNIQKMNKSYNYRSKKKK